MKASYLLLFAFLLGLQAAYLVRLEIAPYTVDCMGAFPARCLQIKENSNSAYFGFNGQLIEFIYEEGVRYFLVVDKSIVPNMPPGISNVQYVLRRLIISYKDEYSLPVPETNVSKWLKVYVEPANATSSTGEFRSTNLMQPVVSEMIG